MPPSVVVEQLVHIAGDDRSMLAAQGPETQVPRTRRDIRRHGLALRSDGRAVCHLM